MIEIDKQYSEGFIAFVDILGFSKYIEDNEDTSPIHDVFNFAEKVAFLFNTSDINGVRIAFFSDSYVLTTSSISNQSFMSLMQATYMINNAIFKDSNLFTRSAVTFGKFYHKDNIAFGPGIIDAYRLQEKHAKYVRTIISEKALELINNDLLIFKSRDGQISFNWYLFEAIDVMHTKENELKEKNNLTEYQINNIVYDDIYDTLSKQKDIILSMLDNYKETQVYEKYLWLINPFNNCCNFMFKIYNSKLTNQEKNSLNELVILLDTF